VVDLGPLLNLMYRKTSAASVVAAPSFPACRAESEAEELVAAVENGAATGASAVVEGEVSPGDRAAAELVSDSVNVQMATATSPETRLQYGSMPTIPNSAGADETQGQLLQTFQLRPGASDVTSYHDFHTLQIAFQHVWTRIFDGELETLGRELYREYVKLKDFSGSTEADRPVSTLDDLRRLMDEVRKLSQIVADEIPRDLRGGGSGSTEAKGSDDLSDEVKTGLGIATGGVSWLVEAVINAVTSAGKKPLITWDSFPGPLPGRFDLIEYSLGSGPKGIATVDLETDPGARFREIGWEYYDEKTGRIQVMAKITNDGKGNRMLIPTPLLDHSLFEFTSNDNPGTPGWPPTGRYVLADLTAKLGDGSHVTFTWKGQ
jgi:hypothetical protein